MLLAGCADYLSNHDSVTLGAGNAIEANIGIHTRNPFPPNAGDTYILGDGKKVAQAMGGYYGVPLGRGGGSSTQPQGKKTSGAALGGDGRDLDCSDVDGPVPINGADPHRLDGDNDGIGCED